MKAADLPTLSARLGELAEYYERRAPGKAALAVWKDVLAEASMDDILPVLTDWPKAHRAMPLADEVLKACRLLVSERVEAAAEENRRTQGSLRDMVVGLSHQSSEDAKEARAQIAEWARRQRNADPKGWAKRLKAREWAGDKLLPIQQAAWRVALREAA